MIQRQRNVVLIDARARGTHLFLEGHGTGNPGIFDFSSLRRILFGVLLLFSVVLSDLKANQIKTEGRGR